MAGRQSPPLPFQPLSTAAMAPHSSSPSSSSSGATTSVQVGESVCFVSLAQALTLPLLQRCAFGPRRQQTLRRFPLAFRELSFTRQRPPPSLSTPSLLHPLPLALPPLSLLLPHPGKNKCSLLTKSILPIPHSMRSLQAPPSLSFRAFWKALIAPFSPTGKLVAARPLP